MGRYENEGIYIFFIKYLENKLDAFIISGPSNNFVLYLGNACTVIT